MRSIPGVMTLDLLRRGRWTLPGAMLLVNAMPLMLLTAMQATAGKIDAGDPSHVMIHVVLTQVNMWMFGVAIVSAQGPVSKLYALPVTTATIVFWRMLPLVVLSALQSLLSTALINTLFGVDWPLWGPALLLAVSMAGAQAILWYADKSTWSVALLALLAIGYGGWMKSRYGGLFSPPDHYWREVTLADAAFMLAMLALAFGLGVAGVARNRRGEAPLSLGLLDWLHRILQGRLGPATPFRSPAAAQFWYEWQKKGWVMPAGTIVGLLLAFALWLFFNREPDNLWEGVFGLGGCVTILGFIAGIIFGNNSASDSNYELGGFLATRPMTTTTLANTLLKACGLSVLLAWLIWAASYVGVYAVLWTTGAAPLPILPDKLHWSYYPATLLGPWVAITLVACAGLSGRILPIVKLGGGLLAAWIGLKLFGQFALSREAHALLELGFTVGLGVLCVAYALTVFIFAWRRGLIDWPIVYVAGSLWGALSITALFVFGKDQPMHLQSLATISLASGLLALAIAPLASAPLALALNRTR